MPSLHRESTDSLMTISPGDSPVTFSVDANTVTLEDDEVYRYIASINGTIGEYICHH